VVVVVVGGVWGGHSLASQEITSWILGLHRGGCPWRLAERGSLVRLLATDVRTWSHLESGRVGREEAFVGP
jgi:hypothetical protein